MKNSEPSDSDVIISISGPGYTGFLFECPGCKCGHVFNTEVTDSALPLWTWNGDRVKPTFRNSLLYESARCHLYVTDGQIQFLADCSHKLAGKTVPMVRPTYSIP